MEIKVRKGALTWMNKNGSNTIILEHSSPFSHQPSRHVKVSTHFNPNSTKVLLSPYGLLSSTKDLHVQCGLCRGIRITKIRQEVAGRQRAHRRTHDRDLFDLTLFDERQKGAEDEYRCFDIEVDFV